jgi:uncharacterized Zn finger protein
MARKSATPDPLRELTWDDLETWAGATTVSRGRRYQENRQVQKLARTPSGGILAWVQGSTKYATRVEWQDGGLVSICTCPVGPACKHAVAALLDGLDRLEQRRALPVVDENDRRLRLLAAEETGDEEAGDEFEEGGAGKGSPEASASRRRGAGQPRSRATLRAFLEQQPKEELVSWLEELGERHPAVRRALEDRRQLIRGAVPKLVRALRHKIAEVAAEPAWSDSWNHRRSTPDYSPVRERLETLLERGHADAVVDLGKELLQAGSRQVENSQDEGETALEISSCLEVVFRALPRSSRPLAVQMLWAVEAALLDDFDLCLGFDAFWQQKRSAADWGTLADQLAKRLLRSEDKGYSRERLVDFLIEALEKAGRADEILPWCEREAEPSGNYLRLVQRLWDAGRQEEAERWIARGVEATHEKRPGIASRLREAWCQQRQAGGDWAAVATFHAENLFTQPSLAALQSLLQAAERAGFGPVVRQAALHFLETGEPPQIVAGSARVSTWPLPPSGLQLPRHATRMSFPQLDTLIALAIAEKRPEEVLGWYDKAGQKIARGWGSEVSQDQIGQAVAATHPERALEIWKRLAEAEIALTKPRAYEAAAGFLRKVRRLLERLGRDRDWQVYSAALRQANSRKRRFVEILDGLDPKASRIIQRGS